MTKRSMLINASVAAFFLIFFVVYFAVLAVPERGDFSYIIRQRIFQYSHGVFSDGEVIAKGKSLYEQKNYAEAKNWLEIAELRGDANAMYLLGRMYLNGDGVAADAQKGIQLLSEAGKKEMPEAYLFLAGFYKDGKGIKPDLVAASRMLYQASQLGNSEAQGLLGDAYAHGAGVTQDWIEAVNWTKKGAEGGDVFAQANLGWLLYQGYGIPKDNKAAIQWLEKAAEKNHAGALLNLADIYSTDRGLLDMERARSYIKRAADSSDPEGQYRLGNHYASGNVVGKNSTEAAAFYLKSAKQSYAPGCHQLGLAYIKGDGVAHDISEGMKWLEKAAQLGSSDAAYDMGLIFWDGSNGVAKDEVKAFTWLSNAANKGNVKANNYVGLALIKGIGVERNVPKGNGILEANAARGDETAKTWLAETRAAEVASRKDFENKAAADLKQYEDSVKKVSASMTCPQGNYKSAAEYRRNCSWLNGSRVAFTHQERTARDTAFGIYRYLESAEFRARMDQRIHSMMRRR